MIQKNIRLLHLSMLLVISIIVLAVGSFVAVSFNIVPLKYSSLFYGLVFIIAGVAATTGISKVVYSKMAKSVGEHNATSLSFIVKIFGYTLTLLVLFSYFKISVTAALAAGGFSGLILGLASQNVMSNIFGGITILTTKPFKINDRITVSTWQYGLIAPAYPPKFWSNDFIIPGYTGIVKVVSLIYTQIITDDNVPLKIPNSVLIQAAIFVQSDSNSRMVKVKYEIPKIVDPELAISNIGRNLRSLKLIKNTPSIKVLESTLNTYIIVIDALCEGQYEELPKSEIIKITMRTVNRLVKRSR